jgi:CII-binding regulator of phage lambda lysogenization HflD
MLRPFTWTGARSDLEQRLRELLEELHNELEQDESVGREPRDLLRTVMGDIQERLDRDGEEAPDWPASLGDRLRESLEHFGESHPTVTSTVGRVIDALSSMGI